MARTILIEATPWDNAGNVANVYLAGGGSRAYTHRGRNTWKAGIVSDPKFTAAIGFNESGWTGGSIPQTTKVSWFPADKATLSSVAAYQWIQAPITILVGDDATAAPAWAASLTGTVAGIAIRGGAIEFTISDLSVKLANPFLTARFGGTGGVDGETTISNRIKRRSFGKVFNVEGLILNIAANVYEFGDPAFPLNAFSAVRDKGRVANPAPTVLPWQGSIAATYAALVASSPASGSAVVAPSIACVKWWTQPAGPLTADIQGDVGAGYVNTVVAIAQRIASTISGLTWTAPAAAVTAGIAGTDEAGIHCGDDSEMTSTLLDRLLLGASLVWILDPSGAFQVREFSFANPVEALTIIDGAERVEGYRPNTSRRVAYQRSYRLHTDGEISAAVKTADIEGLGGLATANSVAFNDGTVKTSAGVTATDASYQTGLGTALAIANQAAAATDTTVVPKLGTIASGATADITLTALTGDYTVSGNAITKTTASGWTPNAQVVSAEKVVGAGVISLRAPATTVHAIVAFDVSSAARNPPWGNLIGADFNSTADGGDGKVYLNNGVGNIGAGITWAANDIIQVVYDNANVYVLCNGVQVGGASNVSAVGAGLTYYVKATIYQQNGVLPPISLNRTVIPWAANVGAGLPENSADVTKSVTWSALPSVPLNLDSSGSVVAGQLPMTLPSPAVLRGGIDVTTNNLTTYTISGTTGALGAVTVDTANGSGTKGQVSIPSSGTTGAGSFFLNVFYNGVAVQSLQMKVVTKQAAAASNGGVGSTSASISVDDYLTSTTDVQLGTGPVTVTVSGGKSIVVNFADTINAVGINKTGTVIVTAQYSPTGANTWSAIGSTATASASTDGSGSATPGTLSLSPRSVTPAAATYDVRLVARKSGTSVSVTFDVATATIQVQ